jgi:hypothetical protein
MTTVRIVSRPAALATLAIVAALGVGACSSGANPSAVASALANASLPPLPSEAATPLPSAPASSSGANQPSESALPTAIATDIDPCQLITADQASTLVGVKFGAGKESDNGKNVKICSYAGPGPNIFMVEVAVAPDVATAKAAEAAVQADIASTANEQGGMGLTVTQLPNFAANTDAAMLAGQKSGGGLSIAARAMLVLRNATFFAFSDLAAGGGQPPSEQAMKDKANEILATLPQ